MSVPFSQSGESPKLSQPGGGDKNFSQEGGFSLTKKKARKKKPMHDRPHTPKDERNVSQEKQKWEIFHQHL